MLVAADDGGMFLASCTECGLRELRGARSIELLVNTDHGAEAVYRCTRCRAVNVLAPTAPVTAPAPVPASVAA